MAMFARNGERRAALTRRHRAAAIVLAAVNLGLGFAVALEIGAPSGAEPAPTAAERQVASALPPSDFSLPPLDAYRAVVDRPLFAHDRRPLPPPAPSAAAGDLSAYTLAGITISGKERTALVRRATPPAVARLAVGQVINGWTVTEIADDHVVVRAEGSEKTISLYKDADGKR